MTWQNDFQQVLFSKATITRAWIGGGIAFTLLAVFLLAVGGMNDGAILWPLITIAIGGAGGGAFYHVMGLVRQQGGWKMIMANIACVLVYIVSCWLGLVFGLSVIGLWH